MRNFLILSLTVFLILPLVQCGKKTPVVNSTENNVTIAEDGTKTSEPTMGNIHDGSESTETETATKDNEYGAHGAIEEESFTIEEMIVYAMQDELFAHGEYEYIINELGAGKPFTNIIKSERNHINMLRPYVTKYEINIDEDQWKEELVYPTSIKEAIDTCIDAEIYNIKMYEKFLLQDLPDDLRDTFDKLKRGSENHLESFRKSRNSY
ncbi:MAG: DUF2202 domain-containing protein [Caldisericia bacterium]|nr:DUF2202 domain-containing protein [Caldisericia bacterium]